MNPMFYRSSYSKPWAGEMTPLRGPLCLFHGTEVRPSQPCGVSVPAWCVWCPAPLLTFCWSAQVTCPSLTEGGAHNSPAQSCQETCGVRRNVEVRLLRVVQSTTGLLGLTSPVCSDMCPSSHPLPCRTWLSA